MIRIRKENPRKLIIRKATQAISNQTKTTYTDVDIAIRSEIIAQQDSYYDAAKKYLCTISNAAKTKLYTEILASL